MADWGSGSAADINEAIEACIENVNTDWENDVKKIMEYTLCLCRWDNQ